MSRNRAADESGGSHQTKEGSDPVLQQRHNAKPTKPIPLSKTMLQDLPIELLDCILVKVVVAEVMELKLAKRVWKEKADLVIGRLRSVCSLWSSVLATNFFRSEVNGTLNNSTQETISSEILFQSSPMQSSITRVASMKDEVFMLCSPENLGSFINVYDRNDIEEIKDVIQLPRMQPLEMVACSVSNCLYVLSKGLHCHSVFCITKDKQQQFTISSWINDLSSSVYDIVLFTTVSGCLIVLSRQVRPMPLVLRTYSASGFLKQELMLTPRIHGFSAIFSVIQKSNGNLILGTFGKTVDVLLKEMDATGRILREYQSSVFGDNGVTVADDYGRMAIIGCWNRCEVVDSEFNLLNVTASQPFDRGYHIPRGAYYNRERKEIVTFYEVDRGLSCNHKTLVIFRFTDE